jgi:hypothetical protein
MAMLFICESSPAYILIFCISTLTEIRNLQLYDQMFVSIVDRSLRALRISHMYVDIKIECNLLWTCI